MLEEPVAGPEMLVWTNPAGFEYSGETVEFSYLCLYRF